MLGRGRQVESERDPVPEDTASDSRFDADELDVLLEAIETLAIRLYTAHGLPGVPGHYRRPAKGGAWELVKEDLTPAEKFDLILDNPEPGHWRYASYERLGAHHDNPDVRHASALLAACGGIRLRLESGVTLTAQTLADAVRMGAIYQVLALGQDGSETLPDLLTIPTKAPEAETET